MRTRALNKAIAAVLLSICSAVVMAKEPTYVGGGRYTCHDKSAACAIVKQNNKMLSERQHAERRAKRRQTYRPSYDVDTDDYGYERGGSSHYGSSYGYERSYR